MKTQLPRAKTPKYEALADVISGLVKHGTFRPGDRIPSVRKLSRDKGVSVTTVLEAYRLLEDRGVIEARPQSGYFVCWQPFAASSPQPSMSAPPPDPTPVNISELHMEVERNASDENLIRFGAAVPDPRLLPADRLDRILGAVARSGEVGRNVFVAAQGWGELRVQVAKRLFAQGCSLAPDEVIITSGCTESLNLALRATTAPGDLVAVESPVFFSVLEILESLGLQALEIPTHPRTGMSLEALRFALDHNRVSACVVTSNFSNPLGCSLSDGDKKKLVELLSERRIPLVEDDIFGELYFEGPRPTVAKSHDEDGLVLLCSSFTKDIAPGYRVGWIAPGRFAARVNKLRTATTCGSPVVSQMVIAEFLARGGYEHHLRRMRRAYAQRVNQMGQAVIRWFPPGTKVTTPGGGFLLWVEMPATVDALALYQLALEAGMSVVPGHVFSMTPQFSNCIRLNAAYWSEATEPALIRLAELARGLAVT